jgi:hypothetical protein
MPDPLVLSDKHASQILRHLEKRPKKSSASVEAEYSRIQKRFSQLKTWSEKAYLDKLSGTYHI